MDFNLKKVILDDGAQVEVLDALSSHVLDMEMVYYNYYPSPLSLFERIFGLRRGVQITEEVLREGSYITAIGEVELVYSGLRIQPSTVGPMFLTSGTPTTVLRRMKSIQSRHMFVIFIFGTVGALSIGLIAWKRLKKRREETENKQFREWMKNSRKERQLRQREEPLTDEQRCVVCLDNPKEVIVLPCGDFCLCEDCAEKAESVCPVCSGEIQTKAPAYYS